MDKKMNKVILVGRLTAEPECRYISGEKPTAVVRYRIAVDRQFKRQGENSADFINITAFGKSAEFVQKYLHQGTKIGIVGRIQTGSYTNRDGQKVYTTDVVVEETEFAESKGAQADSGFQPASRPQPSAAMGDGFMNIPDGIDEELPFN